MSRHDLLRPSLEAHVARPIYSVGALIAAAFFGGSFAVMLLAAENSRRLGRWRVDCAWLALGFVIAAGGILAAQDFFTDPATNVIDSSSFRMANRALAFALVGGAYLLHRKAYRASTVTGLDPPSPYVAVIAVVIVGTLLALGLFAAYSVFSGGVQ
jgi:hypothetical protein